MDSMPSIEHWISGTALFLTFSFTFTIIVGVIGIKTMVSRKWFWILTAVAALLSLSAWRHAAIQNEQKNEIQQRAHNLEKDVRRMADTLKVNLDQSVEALAKEIIDRLIRPWRLNRSQIERLEEQFNRLRERGLEFRIGFFPIQSDKDASTFARDITSLLASMRPEWPYTQPGVVWADPTTEGIHVAISDNDDINNPPESARHLERVFKDSGLPIGRVVTERGLRKGEVGLVIGSKPRDWEVYSAP